MRGNYYIVRGARVACTFGSHIRRLDLPCCHGSYIREKPQMHELDRETELNIPSFGACSSPYNTGPAITVSTAQDVMPVLDEKSGQYTMPSIPIAGALCAPVMGARWCDAHEDTLIDGVPALTMDSTIGCTYAKGIVYFIDNGQEF